ncbi:MAG: hypothetical protein ACRD1G_11890 [Acidimicrobiales bacterium]
MTKRVPDELAEAYAAAIARYPLLDVATVHQAIEGAALLDEMDEHTRALNLRWMRSDPSFGVPYSVAKRRQNMKWSIEALRRTIAWQRSEASREELIRPQLATSVLVLT